ADVEQECQPVPYLLEQFARDHLADSIQALFHLGEPGHQIADRHRPDVDERVAADADGPGLGVEPVTAARAARDHTHVLFELQAAGAGGSLLEAAEELRNNPFPGAAVLPDPAAALLPLVGDVPVAGPGQ